ncbi:MAG: winged helix-turn-helix transcriptional regulator [Candidatus Magnetomorum sp.]|nr:winged helix-turn-helix transcriptional regulator [Candidatus Magnetomorum sp.]
MDHTTLSKHDAASDVVLIELRRIIQSIDLHSRALVKRVGLTGPQLVVLKTLSQEGEVSVGELSKVVSLRQATVTGILERLNKRGLVSRRRSNQDRRRVLVLTTEKAERLLKKTPSLLQDSFVEQFNNLHDWEQSMIQSALQRIVLMMDAKKINAEPILTTGPIDEQEL